MELKYNSESSLFISTLKDFKKEDFEKWYIENNVYINIVCYLEYAIINADINKKFKFLGEIKDIVIDESIKFQKQMLPIIENTNLDIYNLKRFFMLQRQIIGTGSILQYYDYKNKKV